MSRVVKVANAIPAFVLSILELLAAFKKSQPEVPKD